MLNDAPVMISKPASPRPSVEVELPPEVAPELVRETSPLVSTFLVPQIEKFSSLMKAKKKKRNHLSAALNIGSFLKTNVDELDVTRQAIIDGDIDIASTWHFLENMTQEAIDVLTEDERDSIDAFKDWIKSDIELASKIGDDNLIQLGQGLQHYRLALICLILNHSPENVEALKSFNLKHLSRPIEDAEAVSSLAAMILNCPSLPIELLSRLGGEHELTAKNVLNDIRDHKDFNTISEHFYFVHWPDDAPERNPDPEPTPQASPRKISPLASPVKQKKKKEDKPSRGRSVLSHIVDVMLGGSAVAAGFGLYLSEPALAAFVLYAPYVAVPVVFTFGAYQMKKVYDGRYKTPDPVKGDPILHDSESEPEEEPTKKAPPKTAPIAKPKKVKVEPLKVEDEAKPIKVKKKKRNKVEA